MPQFHFLERYLTEVDSFPLFWQLKLNQETILVTSIIFDGCHAAMDRLFQKLIVHFDVPGHSETSLINVNVRTFVRSTYGKNLDLFKNHLNSKSRLYRTWKAGGKVKFLFLTQISEDEVKITATLHTTCPPTAKSCKQYLPYFCRKCQGQDKKSTTVSKSCTAVRI
jgi:hypothetical protein